MHTKSKVPSTKAAGPVGGVNCSSQTAHGCSAAEKLTLIQYIRLPDAGKSTPNLTLTYTLYRFKCATYVYSESWVLPSPAVSTRLVQRMACRVLHREQHRGCLCSMVLSTPQVLRYEITGIIRLYRTQPRVGKPIHLREIESHSRSAHRTEARAVDRQGVPSRPGSTR